MTLTGTQILDTKFKVGHLYAITIDELTAGHTTAIQRNTRGGFKTITDATGTGADPQDHVIVATSERLKILVSAGTGSFEVGVTEVQDRT